MSKVTWCQRIEKAYRNRTFERAPIDVRFRPPASQQKIASLEKLLKVEFPTSLRELLLESNGVMDCMQLGKEWMDIGWLLWPVSEIQQHNTWLRSAEGQEAYDRRFDDLLFFAGVGIDGILFGYTVTSGTVQQDDVYIWYPIRNIVNPLVPSLEEFVDEWIGGKLAV